MSIESKSSIAFLFLVLITFVILTQLHQVWNVGRLNSSNSPLKVMVISKDGQVPYHLNVRVDTELDGWTQLIFGFEIDSPLLRETDTGYLYIGDQRRTTGAVVIADNDKNREIWPLENPSPVSYEILFMGSVGTEKIECTNISQPLSAYGDSSTSDGAQAQLGVEALGVDRFSGVDMDEITSSLTSNVLTDYPEIVVSSGQLPLLLEGSVLQAAMEGAPSSLPVEQVWIERCLIPSELIWSKERISWHTSTPNFTYQGPDITFGGQNLVLDLQQHIQVATFVQNKENYEVTYSTSEFTGYGGYSRSVVSENTGVFNSYSSVGQLLLFEDISNEHRRGIVLLFTGTLLAVFISLVTYLGNNLITIFKNKIE